MRVGDTPQRRTERDLKAVKGTSGKTNDPLSVKPRHVVRIF